MEPIIIALSGRIASGKTAISKAVAENLNLPRVSFGDYVRLVARQRGLPESREFLQRIGSDLVERNVKQFCYDVLAQVNWQHRESVIIDGIRHIKVLNTLREITAPVAVYLIFIKVDETVREARLLKREEENSIKYQRHLEWDSTENQVKGELEKVASLVIYNFHSLEDIKMEVIDWIRGTVMTSKEE
jgi:dephospho-CoA kinase